MAYNTHYGGIIWTNHAKERLINRGVDQSRAAETFQSPDKTSSGKNPGTMQYEKKFGNSTITLIAKQNEYKEWIILSGWIDPPLPGTADAKKKEAWKKYKKSGFWGKFWYLLKQQLGIK
ncbi:MAG TPA: hypothetical protein VLG12_03155 [Candidatus Saccharimonadales bacterium]|nr:hypothetical protein [Candidatus Saccharimonadales bacterium]